jgi:TctA family transporter
MCTSSLSIAFAAGNNLLAVLTVGAFGVIGYVMERGGYPVAAMVSASSWAPWPSRAW